MCVCPLPVLDDAGAIEYTFVLSYCQPNNYIVVHL